MIHIRPVPGATGLVLLATLLACGETIEPGTGAVASVTVGPAGPHTLEVGQQLNIAVTLRDAGGAIVVDRPITIVSTNPAVVKFQTGFIEAVAPGDAFITATSEGITDSLAVTVTPAAVATVSVAPVRAELWPVEQEGLVAVARDARGRTLENRPVTWTSGNTAVATVSDSGVVTAVANGTAMISATAEGVTEEVEIVVRAPVSYAEIRLADGHSCAITPGQAAYCWGRGELGQLGVGLPEDQDSPEQVTGGFLWQSIGGAVAFGCGVTTGNAAYCWGADFRHRLGNDTLANVCDGTPCRTEPNRPVVGGFQFTQVGAGNQHGCGLLTDGRVACWGDNSQGQLGNDTMPVQECGQGQGAVECSEQPVPVQSMETFTTLSAGAVHTCALNGSGAAFCWGGGGSGRLGVGAGGTRFVPSAVAGGLTFTAITAGGAHTCAIATGGAAYCWGEGGSGQVGNGATDDQSSPAAVSGGLSFTDIAAGGSHACGIATDGTAWCWGQGSSGQVGTGAPVAAQSTPAQVAGGLTFSTIAAGGQHTCGRTTGGVVYCWGDNGRGQLGVGTTVGQVAAPARVLGQN